MKIIHKIRINFLVQRGNIYFSIVFEKKMIREVFDYQIPSFFTDIDFSSHTV